MDSTSDKALMRKVKDGDLDKLGLLFERYNRRLFGFFFRLTNRRDVSEDLVQGVFERILKYRNSYTGEGSFSTWIFQIARNLHADYYRKTQRLMEDRQADWENIPAESEPDALKERLNGEEQLLDRALEKLDPHKKQTLILSRFEGFKYREIAKIMNCSESAVKVRIFRTLDELREIMSELKKQEKP